MIEKKFKWWELVHVQYLFCNIIYYLAICFKTWKVLTIKWIKCTGYKYGDVYINYLDFLAVFSLQLFKNVNLSFQPHTFLNEDNFDFFLNIWALIMIQVKEGKILDDVSTSMSSFASRVSTCKSVRWDTGQRPVYWSNISAVLFSCFQP